MSNKYVVLGVESVSYVNKSATEVNIVRIYYFDLSDKGDDRLEKGYRLLSKDVYPDFSASDFPEVPGIYDLQFRPSRNRMGKMEPKLVSVDFKESFKISSRDNYYLLLAGKRYSFQADGKGKPINGIKFFMIDPLGYQESDNFLGYPILEASLDKSAFDPSFAFPGYYQVELEQVRGRNGDSLYKLVFLKLHSAFTFSPTNSLSPV